jgi:hypothetical protein
MFKLEMEEFEPTSSKPGTPLKFSLQPKKHKNLINLLARNTVFDPTLNPTLARQQVLRTRF